MGTSDAAVGIGTTKSRVSALKLRQPVVRLAALFVFLVLLFTAGLATSQASAQDLLVNISDAGSDPTPAGGTISYSVAVSNNDFVTSSPVTTLTLTVDAGTTFIGATGTITGCTPVPAVGPATVTCDVPVLAAGASVSLVAEVLTTTSGTYDFGASVPVLPGDSDPDNNSLTEPTTVTAGADMSLALSGPATSPAGSVITYSFEATNNGPDPAANVLLRFPIPTGIGNVVPPPGCVLSGSVYSCTIAGPIAVGATVSLDFQGQISAASGSNIAAVGSVGGGTPADPIAINNGATLNTAVTAGSDLSIAKARSPSGTLLVGDAVTFTVTPTYTGDSPSGIVVRDTIPANYAFDLADVTAPGWICTVTGQILECTRTTGSGPGANVPLGPITIDTTIVSSGSPTNTAEISASGPPDPIPGNNTASDGGATILDPTIDLQANKSGPVPPLVVVGNSYTFSISTSNIGNSPFFGTIEMTDTLPAGLEVTSYGLNGWDCSPAVTVVGPASILCTRDYTAADPLPAGATTPAVVLTTTVTADGPILNGLEVGSPNPNLPDLNLPNNVITYGVTGSDPTASADIAVNKSVGLATLPVGEIQTFTLEVTNAGPTASSDVTLTDNLLGLINSAAGPTDAGLVSVVATANSATGLSCLSSPSGGTSRLLTCTIDTLPVCTPGSTCPVITVEVRPGGEAGGRSNTASVISNTTADPDLTNNADIETYSVEARADVTVTKTDSADPVAAGQNLTYVIAAQNLANGLSSAEDVTITDTLPADVTFISASPSSGSCSTVPAAGSTTGPGNNGLVCNLGTIANGAQQTVTVVVRPNLVTRGTTLTNGVTVATETTEIDTTNNSATETTAVASPSVDLLINKDDSIDPLTVGDDTVYSVTVTNLGPSAAENVVVTDSMPPTRIAYRSHVVPADGSCSPVPTVDSLGEQLICSFPVIPAGETRVITITGRGVAKGSALNSATVASAETALGFETNTGNNLATETTSVRTRVDLEVTSKVATPATVNLREPFTFLITVRNNTGPGRAEADDVVISDSLPAGMELTGTPTVAVTSGSTTASSCTGAAGSTSFTCSLGTFSLGGEVEVTVPVRVVTATSAGQSFTNTSSIATSSFDEVTANNANSGPVTINSSSIGGTVFRDFADDGALTAGDSGIAGVTMTLTGTAFDGTPITRTVTTGPGGTYSFDLLPAGTYTITQGSISEAYLTDGQTAAGSEGGTVAPTVISAITLPANTAATDYLFPKVPQARVAIAKAVQAGPTVNPDGSFTVTFRLNVQNFSLEALTDVEVTDALEGAAPLFGTYVGSTPTTPGTYTMAAAPTGSCGGLNASYNGAGDQVVATGFGMPATSTCFIDLQLQVIPTNPPPPLLAGGARYLNQAEIDATGAVSGQTSATNPQLTDLSDNGTSPDPDGDGQGNEAGENDPTPLALDLTAGIRLVKSLSALADTNGNGRVDPGDTATYSFAVTNTGQVLLANVTVTDPLVTVSGGPITLGVGETNSTAFTASYVLTQDDIDRGYVENTALTEGDAVAADGSPILDDLGNPVTVSDVSDTGTDATGAPVGSPETTETPDGTGGTDGDPTNDPTVIVLSQTPGVVLEKRLVSVTDTTGDGLIGDGDTAAYAFTVTNTGLVRLIDVTVTDPLVTMSGGPIDLAVGASDSTSFTATYVITQADVDRGFVDNSATVTGTAATSAGDPILGPGGVPITVSDISDTGTAPDGSAVAAPATTETVSAGGVTDADPTNDPTSFLLSPSASIQLVKRISGTTDVNGNGIVDLGDIVNYAFVVTNTGNVTLAGVTVTDPIVTVAGGPITLAPGATDTTTFTASYTLVADDITRTYVQNTATADGNAVTVGGDPIPGTGGGPLTATDISDTGTAPDGSTVTDPETTETPDALGGTDGDPTNDPTVIRVGIPEIELDIEIADILDTNGNGIIDAGDTIVYTFTVTNTGTVPLTDVNMDPASLSVPLGLTCTPISLPVGETQTLVCTGNTYVITDSDVAAGTVTLSGTATGESPTGQVVSDDDSVVSPVLGLGGIAITKTVDHSQVNPGEVVTYTITVTNTSDSLTTVTNIVDVLPRGFIYQPGTGVLDGAATEPSISGRTLTWAGVSLPPGGSAVVELGVLVSASAGPGDHDNIARAVSPVTGRAVSADALATVRVMADPVFACSTIIGRVFDDLNQDGYYNYNAAPVEEGAAITDQTYYADKYETPEEDQGGPDGAEDAQGPERGIPGVRMVAPNGLSVTTDAFGRYSLPCAALPADIGSNFMLKLDTRTLPSGYRLTTENPRVVRVTPGMLTKLNFGATISRVVRIDLSGRAFRSGDEARAPRAELVEGLKAMVAEIASTPAVLRISYQLAEGESERLAKQRMREVERLLRRLWPANGRYQLNVETVIQSWATRSVNE